MTDSQTKPNENAPPAATTDVAWRAVADATQGAYEVLAELARDADGAVAFVGRPLTGGDLVVLKLEPDADAVGAARYTLFELRKLDETVPAPRISCPICNAHVAAWRGRCAACGSVIGAGTDGPVATDILLAFYQFVSATYDVIGELATEGSGPPAYLVRTRGEQHYVVLRLALGGTVASGSVSYMVDVLPLAQPGGTPAAPTRVPLDVGAPTAVVAKPEAPANLERVCPQCGSLFGAGTLFCPRDGASLRLVTQGTDLVGQLIDDRYYVEQRLGEGGMGEVYIAHQVRTGRKCALKLMHRSMTQDPDAVGRFRREAASACAISHPNVATIFDSGETIDQRPYFAMEFVDGRPLSHVIRDEGPLDPWRAADIARQIADGLTAAHDLDIIHRDLKPDNVMLGTARGGADFVKLVDFGIAKPTKGVGNTLTRTGFILGTPAYMSPEQLCADKLDGRSDLYSLGCVLHEMLTGATPFAGQSLEMLMMRRLTEPPPHPRALNEHVPQVLDDIVARLLARSADERYPDARTAADVLGAAQDAIGGRRSTTAGAGIASASVNVRTPTPGPRQPSVVKVATSEQTPRRSRDVTPAAPLSPAIPFRAPSLSMPSVAAEPTTPIAAPPPGTSRSSWRLGAAAAAIVVVAGGGFVAWRLTSHPASSAAPVSAGQPAAPSGVTKQPQTGAAPTLDSQTRNSPSVGATDRGLPPRTVEPQPSSRSAVQKGKSPTTQSPATVVQSAAPSSTSTGVPKAPQVTTTAPRDTRPLDSAPPPAAVETKPRVDPAAEAERAETARVRDAVESYVRAIGAKQMDVLLQIFPGMSAAYRDGYGAMFRDVSDLSTTLSAAPTIALHGSTADAQFAYDLAGNDPNRGHFSQHATMRVKLQRMDQRWTFVTLEPVR